jgi:uncharacterized RDD family membrane protein YckC
MHSAEPNEPSFVNSAPPANQETWRAEVALRVKGYRARRKRGDSEDALALDFGPAEAQNFAAPVTVQSAIQLPRSAARNAFDTDYYRRLNAQSLGYAPALAAEASPATELEAGLEPGYGVDELPNDGHDQLAGDPVLDLELRPAVVEESFLDRYAITAPPPEPEPVPVPAVRPQPAAAPDNLILFRRPLEPPLELAPSRDELAEPVYSRPRILEVPEDIMPAVQGSLFPEIRLDADDQEISSNTEPEFEVPLPVALVGERVFAGLTDLGVVLAAGLLFAAIAFFALPGIEHTKPFWMALGGATLLLWALYQHLFLLYAGQTLGMKMKGIRLSTFEGAVPRWSERRARARYMFVSLAAVALGFLWAMVDEDTLCWHDRLSRTFPTVE